MKILKQYTLEEASQNYGVLEWKNLEPLLLVDKNEMSGRKYKSSKTVTVSNAWKKCNKPRLRGFTIAITSTGITSESQLRAAGTARPAAAHSHLAAAAAGGVFPSALGWNVRPDRLWSCSWGRGPHLQTAAELPAAKASVSHTLCSPGAWSAGRHKGRSQC